MEYLREGLVIYQRYKDYEILQLKKKYEIKLLSKQFI